MVIAILYADGALLFSPARSGIRPSQGDTVIYYAPRKNADERRRARAERAEAASERRIDAIPREDV